MLQKYCPTVATEERIATLLILLSSLPHLGPFMWLKWELNTHFCTEEPENCFRPIGLVSY